MRGTLTSAAERASVERASATEGSALERVQASGPDLAPGKAKESEPEKALASEPAPAGVRSPWQLRHACRPHTQARYRLR